MTTTRILTTFFVFYLSSTRALDNGLGLTPPMGWLSWERFLCNTDCQSEPDDCIGERLIRTITDAMVKYGFKDAGYEYVVIDDCWPGPRDKNGRLQGDLHRFPSGMKALADYVHSKGMKFGLYEDVGRHTCAGAPGSLNHYKEDAETFAEWGVDYVKFDGCNCNVQEMNHGYPQMARELNATGRPIFYCVEWPIYHQGQWKLDYDLVAKWSNSFRVYGDIYDNYQSITSIIGFYGGDKGAMRNATGPGHFTDADMLVLGNFGMSHDQEKTQFGMWAMFASSMLISADVRNMNPTSRGLLLNRDVIAINQDRLGIPAKLMKQFAGGKLQIWVRPVTPAGSFAIAFLSIFQSGYPRWVGARLRDIGLQNEAGYSLRELFDNREIGRFSPSANVTQRVNPCGIVLMRATPMTDETVDLKFHGGPQSNRANDVL